MKYLLLSLFLYVGCSGLPGDLDKDALTGTYARFFDHEFARGADTLIVSSEDGMHYSVEKRTGFQRIKNGELMKPERRMEKWSGVFDPATQQVQESKTGKVLHWREEGLILIVGASEYQKVK